MMMCVKRRRRFNSMRGGGHLPALLSTRIKLSSLTLLSLLATTAVATKHHYIHWNASNPIFRIDNTDHIIDVNTGNLPHEFDQANFICPKYSKDRSTQAFSDQEQYVIYNVSKEEYESCHITSRKPKIAAVCNKPDDVLYFTITFRSFSPTPGGMEFKPGQDYYFISTSSDGDLWRKNGGKCTSHNMRLVFKVAPENKGQVKSNLPPDAAVNQETIGGQKGDTFRITGDYSQPPSQQDGTVIDDEEEKMLVGNAVDLSYSEEELYDETGNKQREHEEGSLIKQEASRMHHSSSSSSSLSYRTFLPGICSTLLGLVFLLLRPSL